MRTNRLIVHRARYPRAQAIAATRRRLVAVFITLGIAALLAMALTARLVAAAPQQPTRIAPKDVLKITVYAVGTKEDALSGDGFLVDSDGTFMFPNLGRVKAGGLTTRELEGSLTKELGDKLLRGPQVSVEIASTTSKKIRVGGEVRSPALYELAGAVTLYDAIIRAGSLTDEAEDTAIVHRAATDGGPEEVNTIDLYELLNGTSMDNNVALQDGDIVIVPKAEPVFVRGEVRSPGPIHARRNLTVTQALTMAGGQTDRASKNVRILRTGEKKPFTVANPDKEYVKPGDTITVPARMF
jgi:polysaccharide export outer membrane protein